MQMLGVPMTLWDPLEEIDATEGSLLGWAISAGIIFLIQLSLISLSIINVTDSHTLLLTKLIFHPPCRSQPPPHFRFSRHIR